MSTVALGVYSNSMEQSKTDTSTDSEVSALHMLLMPDCLAICQFYFQDTVSTLVSVDPQPRGCTLFCEPCVRSDQCNIFMHIVNMCLIVRLTFAMTYRALCGKEALRVRAYPSPRKPGVLQADFTASSLWPAVANT